MNRVIRKLVLSWVLITCPVFGKGGNAKFSSQVDGVNLKPRGCVHNIYALDDMHTDTGPDGLIIAIARLGNGETNEQLSLRRLHNVRAYLSDFRRVRSPQSIVLAKGERVQGHGRIDFYIKGSLSYALALERNADLRVGTCYYETDPGDLKEKQKDLYPFKDAWTRKKLPR